MQRVGSVVRVGDQFKTEAIMHVLILGENKMLRIKRNENGTHTVDGEPFEPNYRLYRKKTLTGAIKMDEPFSVETLEGTMRGKAGDYLMIGNEGEMYPCGADIFRQTYEEV
jgi:hypothetical protein